MSELVDDRIAEMIAAGATDREIRTVLKVHSRRVTRVRKERGFSTKESRRLLVAALMMAGELPYRAAEMAGADSSVAYRLRRLGGGMNNA